MGSNTHFAQNEMFEYFTKTTKNKMIRAANGIKFLHILLYDAKLPSTTS